IVAVHSPRCLGLALVVALSAACGGSSSDGNIANGSGQAVTEAKALFADKIGPGKARFPIMLEHGFAASAKEARIWKFDGVADDLMKQGHALVVSADVQPFNDVATRAATMVENVRAAIDRCKTIAACDPRGIHVIAHSFGGLHSREFIRLHPPS